MKNKVKKKKRNKKAKIQTARNRCERGNLKLHLIQPATKSDLKTKNGILTNL